jgi:translin
MHKLEGIANQIREKFDVRTARRDQALTEARQLTRACSLAIRAVHRDDEEVMESHLNDARRLADKLRAELSNYPDLFYAGYTQDALKEFVEANVTCALIRNEALQTPEDLQVGKRRFSTGWRKSSASCAAAFWISCARAIPKKPNACSGTWMKSIRCS